MRRRLTTTQPRPRAINTPFDGSGTLLTAKSWPLEPTVLSPATDGTMA